MARTRTILCVDDNQALAENLREILEDAGYAVRTAGSCAQAMEQARPGFDVALVDVRLPDGDGTALAGSLRAIVPDAQVIMLTGFATIESAVGAVRAGAWAYLMKPCAMPELLVAVEQAVRQIENTEERNDLQRRARMAEKLAAIGTMTAGLSHEIKNPLNAAALQLAVVERRIKRLPAEVEQALGEPLKLVENEITRLNGILEDFLAFARPREIDLAPVDVTGLLGRVVDLLAAQADRVEVKIERRWREVPAARGDGGRLQQAFVNLLLNAIEATPPGGVVRIDLEPNGNSIRIAVEDSGPGIPEELRARIFEPFFTTKQAGSGIGLALVHSIVDQHRGSITVEQGDAGGARFVLDLPAAPV